MSNNIIESKGRLISTIRGGGVALKTNNFRPKHSEEFNNLKFSSRYTSTFTFY